MLCKDGENVAYGVKIKLSVDESASSKQLRSQIQKAISSATAKSPITIKHFKVELNGQDRARITSQLQQALSKSELTIKIKQIDASDAVKNLRKQLTTMLSGLSITGLKEFLGADGIEETYNKAATAANKLAEAQERVKQKASDARKAMQEIKVLQSYLNDAVGKSKKIADGDSLRDLVEQYKALSIEIANVKSLEGAEQQTALNALTEKILKVREATTARLEEQQAEKQQAAAAKQARAEEVKRTAEAERAAKKENTLARQTLSLRQSIEKWISNNTRAYTKNKTEIDGLMDALRNEGQITEAELGKIRLRWAQITEAANKSGDAGQTVFQKLKAGWAKFGGWSIVTKTLMTAVNAIKSMIGVIKNLDAAMTELRKVTDLTEASYARFASSAAQTAKNIGATVADTINATADFARLGYDLDDAAALAEAALVYKNVGDGIEDVSVATESLISTIKAFGYEASEATTIVDMFNEVGNNFAISSSGIGEALQRSASALAEAGNTLEESIGLVTAMNSVVQDPDSVGTALKTLTMYLRAAKTEAESAGVETEGMADSVATLRKSILSLTGVDIMIDADTFKSTYEIIREIANVWDDLTDTSRSNVLNLLGGKRNANVISSLIQNFDDAGKAMNSAMNSFGSATIENEKYLDSINGKIAVMKASFEEMSSNILSSNLVKAFIVIATALENVVTWLTKINMLVPAFSAIVARIHTVVGHVAQRKQVDKISSAFSTMVGQSESNTTAIKALSIAVDGLTQKQKVQLSSLITNSAAFRHLTNEERAAVQSMLAVEVATTAANTGVKKLTSGLKGLWSATSKFNKIAIVITLITAVIGVIKDIVKANEEARLKSIETANDIIDAYSDAQSSTKDNIQSLESLRSKFEKLSAGVDQNGKNIKLTASEYEEYKSIISQIIQLSPSIVSGYDAEGRAIVNYTTLLDDAIAAQNTYLENTRNMYLGKGKDLFDGKAEEYKDIQKELGKAGGTLGDAVAGTEWDAIKSLLSPKNAQEKIDAWKNALKEIGSDISITKTWETAYDELATMYERREDLLTLLTNSGQYDTTEIEEVRTALYGLAGAYTQLSTIETDQIDYLMEWAKDKEWYGNLPVQALDDFRVGLATVNAPLATFNENIAATDAYGEEFAAALASDDAQGLIKLAHGLSNGSTSIAEYNEAFNNFISSYEGTGAVVLGLSAYLGSLSNNVQSLGNNAEQASTEVTGLSDALQQLKKGYDLLSTAESEMANGGGISSDTLKSVMDMLDEGGKLTDYIYTENGLLMLNTEKWKERSDTMMLNDISALEAQRDELQAVSDALNILEKHDGSFMPSPDELSEYEAARATVEAYTGDLKNVDAELANVIATIAIYNAALNSEQDDPLNLTTLFSNLENVGSQADSLLTALDKVKNGVALTGSEIAQLVTKYPELAERTNLFDVTTAEGQMALLVDLLGEYELSYDQLIDAQIASVEEQRKELIARGESADAIDNVIQSLNALKEMNLEGIYGEEQAESATERYQSLENAIDAVSTASGLLKNMNSGSNPVDTLQDILNIVQEYDNVDLNDFISGFAVDGIDFNEDGVTQWVNNVIDGIAGLDALEVNFPGITEWLKENAQAAIETAASYETLSDAMSGIQSAADILVQIKNSENPMDIFDSVIELAKQTGTDYTSFISGFDADGGIAYSIDNITAAMYKSAEGLDELEAKFPGIREHLVQSALASEDATNSYDALSNAIDAVSTASGLLTDIQSDDGNTLDMLQTVADMAKQSGQNISDFLTVDNNALKFNEEAITNWATHIVNSLNEFDDIAPEVRLAMVDMIVAEAEAATAAERMASAYDDAKSALSGMEEMTRGAELTYEAYKELIEIDARYAQAVEYQNGVLTLNALRYDNVSQAIVEETLAMAEAQALAITLSDDYQDLTSRIGELNAEEQQRLDNMNAEIMGYSVLASELRNAASAYNNFVNASSDTDSSRYSAAKDAYQVIDDTLYNEDSDIFGKRGRKQYRYALEYLIDPEIEVDSKEFDEAYKKVERYITEGSEGVFNFYDDLIKNGFLDADTQELYAPLEEVAEKLGVSMEVVRTMFDELNEYNDGDPIEINFGNVEQNADDALSAVERYLGKAQTGLRNFYNDLITGGYMDSVTHQLTMPIEAIANQMGVSAQLVQQVIGNLNSVLSEDMQITPELDTSKLENGTDTAADYATAIDGAAKSTMTAEEKAQLLEERLNSLSEQLKKLNPAFINIKVDSALSNANRVSSALSAIISRLSRIASFGTITVKVHTVETVTRQTSYSPVTSAVNKALSGLSSASGTRQAKGGRTLVGELGTETVVDPNTNKWYTVGNDGAEFVTLPKNAIVFNAEQTKELFEMGRIPERGQALASGNAAATGWLGKAINAGVDAGKKLVKGTINALKSLTGSSSNKSTSGDQASSSNVNISKDSSSKKASSKKSSSSSSSKSGGSSKSNSTKDEQTQLEKLKEEYEELNKQTEHLIEHQEFLYRQAERGLDYSGMETALQEETRLYRKMMEDSQKAVQEMIAAGASDTDEELQSMEKAYWDAYDSLYETLDKINALYVDAINKKVDDIQTAYANLSAAAQEYNDYGGITVDTFQSLIANGAQYLSLLDNVNGKYVINTSGIQKLIAAEKEQLAVESAISYINQLKTALTDKNTQSIANLVNLTNELSGATWDSVYSQAALLKTLGLSDEQFARVIANIDAIRDISQAVITDISANLEDVHGKTSDLYNDQLDALDEILELTMDLIEAEADDRIEAIEDEIDAYQKIIDLKKKSLEISRDEDDYAKKISNKTKEIANLQTRIDQLSLDDSREARAERAKLQEELAQLQDDLGDMQLEHSYDSQMDIFDKMAEEYEAERKKEIDAIEDSISSEEKLYQAAIERLSTRWDSLYNDLIAWNTEAGSSLNSEITENWNKAAEAVLKYGSYLQAVHELESGIKGLEEDESNPSTVVGTGTPTDATTITPQPDTNTPAAPEPEPEQTTTTAKKVKITSGTWWVRTGAGKSNKAVGTVHKGETYQYVDQSGDWYAIKYKGNTRWVFGGDKNLKVIEELPSYHVGGVVGDAGTINDKEVLAVLEKNELVLDEPKKQGLYRLIDFSQVLADKLGTSIGSIAPPSPQISPLFKRILDGSKGGTQVDNSSFSPSIRVEINQSGSITEQDAAKFGKQIADTTINELYDAFQRRGIGSIRSSKLKQ